MDTDCETYQIFQDAIDDLREDQKWYNAKISEYQAKVQIAEIQIQKNIRFQEKTICQHG